MQLQTIQEKIYDIRGQRVMLDFDLAELYEVETRVLKQAVRRNIDRFPEDFLFELTKEEYNSLRSRIVILENGRHAFVLMRQYALSHKDLTDKIKEIETKYDKNFEDVYQAINYLIGEKEQEADFNKRKRIGYKKK